MNQPTEAPEWRSLTAALRVSPLASSLDGDHIHITAPVDSGMRLGGFVVISTPGGDQLVAQVLEARITEATPAELDVDTDAVLGDPRLTGGRYRPVIRVAALGAALIGRLVGDELERRHRPAPFADAPVAAADAPTVSLLLEHLTAGSPGVRVGTAAAAEPLEVPATLVATGFSRHTFLCGQSGSGKTYTTGVVLERLIEHTDLPMVILDPNSDHVGLGGVRPGTGEGEAAAYLERAAAVTVARGRTAEGEDRFPLRIHFSDLDPRLQALLLRLDPVRDLVEYHAFTALSRTVPAPHSLGDLAAAARAGGPGGEALALRIENLGIAQWGLWCRTGESSIVEDGPLQQRILVVDLGSLETPGERAVVSLAVLHHLWERRRDRRPRLIVVDEAHNVLPSVTEDPILDASRELGILIAGEGRKFGLHLLVATQRPGKVHPNVVSQCDNLMLMRMNSAGDIAELCSLFSHVPPGLIRQSPGFPMGTALFAGPISPTPLPARIGARLSPEGGADVPTTWAMPRR